MRSFFKDLYELGRDDGRIEGRDEEKWDMIKNMIECGESIEKISIFSNTSVEEIQEYRDKLQNLTFNQSKH